MSRATEERLAIFVPGMYGGGAERAMLNLANGIAERGYAVDLVLVRAEGPYLAELPPSVRLVNLAASRTLASVPALVRYLRRERPQALLSVQHADLIAVWSRRLARSRTRVVVSVRNTLSSEVQHAQHRRARLIPYLARLFYPWADGITTVSQGVADDLTLVLGIPRERIEVIYNPVVTPAFKAKTQAPLDHPWFAPGEPPVVLGAGRLTIQKDFPALIQAFAEVRQTRPARLLILGEGEERPALEALVRQLGMERDVGLPGFVSNPYPYMRRAALFVLSSRWEGLPGVLIEAMYCGARLVATDCPSGPREILADGRYGQLVPVGNVAALAEGVRAGLDGQIPVPPAESWQLFELGTVVDQYIQALVGS